MWGRLGAEEGKLWKCPGENSPGHHRSLSRLQMWRSRRALALSSDLGAAKRTVFSLSLSWVSDCQRAPSVRPHWTRGLLSLWYGVAMRRCMRESVRHTARGVKVNGARRSMDPHTMSYLFPYRNERLSPVAPRRSWEIPYMDITGWSHHKIIILRNCSFNNSLSHSAPSLFTTNKRKVYNIIYDFQR